MSQAYMRVHPHCVIYQPRLTMELQELSVKFVCEGVGSGSTSKYNKEQQQ